MRMKYDAKNVPSLMMAFAPNRFKHDAGLVLRYSDVMSLVVERSGEGGLGDIQLDEILPHDRGCSHVIKMTGGAIRVVCRDVVAQWHMEIASAGGLGMDGEHV